MGGDQLARQWRILGTLSPEGKVPLWLSLQQKKADTNLEHQTPNPIPVE